MSTRSIPRPTITRSAARDSTGALAPAARRRRPRNPRRLPATPHPTGGALTGPATATADLPTEPHQVISVLTHEALRRDLRRLAEVLRQPVGVARRAALIAHVEFLLAELDHRQRVQQSLVWPAVLRRRPDLQPSAERVRNEHGRLGWLLDRLVAAEREWVSDDGRERVRGAVIDMERVLDPQFRAAEEDLLPVVAATLTGSDWRRVDRQQRRLTTRTDQHRRLRWLLDGASERDRTIVVVTAPAVRWRLFTVATRRGHRRAQQLLWS